MQNLLTITWDMGKGLDLGFFTLRYYSLLFAAGFVLGYLIMQRIFKKEGIPQERLDTLLTYTVISTVVGARLGHVFFYQWDYYSQHPGEILKVWEGGLASHGAAIAIIIAIIIYCRRSLKKPVLWMLDRLVITIILAGALIRLGNWFNSEIYGAVGNSALETVFTNPARERILNTYGDFIEAVKFKKIDGEYVTDSVVYPKYDMIMSVVPSQKYPKESIPFYIVQQVSVTLNTTAKENKNIIAHKSNQVFWDPDKENVAHLHVLGVPRAPTQLYESLGYFMIFLILWGIFQKKNLADRQGFIFGAFLILTWGFRFFIEYLKENQVPGEEGMTLNIGQTLSIPLVVAGIILMVISKNPEKK